MYFIHVFSDLLNDNKKFIKFCAGYNSTGIDISRNSIGMNVIDNNANL